MGVTACGPRPRPACPDPDERYQDYGFIFENFDDREMQVLGVTVEDYADQVGGSQQLRRLIRSKWDSVVVWKDPANIGADTTDYGDIRLGTTAFDRALAAANNYSDWGAVNNDEYAQNVFGHEIGHNLLAVLRPTKDWAVEYQNNVSRGDGAAWIDTREAGEEAVTNLTLYVLQRRYFWSIYPGPGDKEKDPARTTVINDWVQDVLDALKNY